MFLHFFCSPEKKRSATGGAKMEDDFDNLGINNGYLFSPMFCCCIFC